VDGSVPHACDIFNTNQQGHTPTPTTKPFPSVTYEDYNTPPDYLEDTYKEYGMTTEVYEPWEFEDQLSKAPSYYGEPDILREAREGSHRCTELLLNKWMFVGSQYSDEVQEMWLEQEAEYQERLREWEDLRLDLNDEERKQLEREEREYEDLEFELPPPTPIDTPTQPLTLLTTDQRSQHPLALFSPSPTYETTIGHQLTPAP
jgi:hypothetical protein